MKTFYLKDFRNYIFNFGAFLQNIITLENYKNVTSERKFDYPDILTELGHFNEAILEYEEILKSLTSSDDNVLKVEVLKAIQIIYLRIGNKEGSNETLKRIDLLNIQHMNYF